ncbi:MAG: LysM peptidoglycan-binding domain-containing protein [Rhizobiales bacterium]|nr:LysM peptidoglycan-binding domain-containing protein [Hyphomicrobiales bacterium]
MTVPEVSASAAGAESSNPHVVGTAATPEPAIVVPEISASATGAPSENPHVAGTAAAPELAIVVPEVSASVTAPETKNPFVVGTAAAPDLEIVLPEVSARAAATEAESPYVAANAVAPQARLDGPQVAIRAAEVDARNFFVAGEAAPGTLVRVYADEVFVGEVKTGNGGHWLVEAERDVPLGEVVIRADSVEPEAEAPTLGAELPFIRYADGIVLEPVVAAAERDEAAASVTAELPPPTLVIIRRGDNLWRISRRNYGRGIRYKSIFAANSDRIRDPDLIYPGQVFFVPTRDRGWETAEIEKPKG